MAEALSSPHPFTDADLDTARRAIRMEAAGLEELARTIDGGFARAVAALEAVHGRVILSGMGKSGHVAHKVAATLASTGTPAQYVHPGEASHGDLGMIAAEDAVIALSNSGETPEFGDIIAYTRRFSIPLIAMTRDPASTLGSAADIVLQIPRAREACPMGLAPTTSTTMMLALGDALAVTLLDRKGFTSSDFGTFHPGGKLGQRLQRVDALMRGGAAMPLLGEAARMGEAILEISAKSLGCVGILDGGGRLTGIVTDGDLRRHMSPSLLERPVAEIMNRTPQTVGPRAMTAEAVRIMNERKITSLFVLDGERRPLGILHIHDCLRAKIV